MQPLWGLRDKMESDCVPSKNRNIIGDHFLTSTNADTMKDMYPLPYSLWRMPSQLLPEQFDYMLIDPTRGRSISLHILEIDPVKRASIWAWYRQGGPGMYSARINLAREWRDFSYRLDGNTIYWKWGTDDVEQCWEMVAESEVPERFFKAVERRYAQMDSAEEMAREKGSE